MIAFPCRSDTRAAGAAVLLAIGAAEAVRRAVRPLIQAVPDAILAAARKAGAGALTDMRLKRLCSEEWNRAHPLRPRP